MKLVEKTYLKIPKRQKIQFLTLAWHCQLLVLEWYLDNPTLVTFTQNVKTRKIEIRSSHLVSKRTTSICKQNYIWKTHPLLFI